MIQLDRTLTYRLHLLHKLTDVKSQRAYVVGAGLSMSDGRCLTAVGTFAPLSVNELAKKANLDKGQASRAAQSLVEQGLVLKAASPTDGRGVVLTLTPPGRAAWQRAMAVVGQRNQITQITQIHWCSRLGEATRSQVDSAKMKESIDLYSIWNYGAFCYFVNRSRRRRALADCLMPLNRNRIHAKLRACKNTVFVSRRAQAQRWRISSSTVPISRKPK